MSNDYDNRASTYGFANANEIKAAVAVESAVILDVRGQDEIKVAGKWETSRKWLQTPCTPDECPILSATSDVLLPNKDAPVIVYCKSGRRAWRAQQILQQKGYRRVLNAGGLEDLKRMQL